MVFLSKIKYQEMKMNIAPPYYQQQLEEWKGPAHFTTVSTISSWK